MRDQPTRRGLSGSRDRTAAGRYAEYQRRMRAGANRQADSPPPRNRAGHTRRGQRQTRVTQLVARLLQHSKNPAVTARLGAEPTHGECVGP